MSPDWMMKGCSGSLATFAVTLPSRKMRRSVPVKVSGQVTRDSAPRERRVPSGSVSSRVCAVGTLNSFQATGAGSL